MGRICLKDPRNLIFDSDRVNNPEPSLPVTQISLYHLLTIITNKASLRLRHGQHSQSPNISRGVAAILARLHELL
jgi:hypothetical protein